MSAAASAPDGAAGFDQAAAPTGFGELLRQHRLAAGLSQRELADQAQLSERAVRDLENGATRRPRLHSLRAVAAAIGLSGYELTSFITTGQNPGRPALPPTAPLSAVGPLIGRDDELRRLADLVVGRRHRLITVVGAGGVGKSRLVAELVPVLRDRHGLGVHTLDLSALDEPALLGELVAETLGCGSAARLGPVERIAAQLRDGRLVLVLDCFERLVPVAPLVATLVQRCSGLTVLITSQRLLRVRGERPVQLDPLPGPAAAELFVQCATAVRPTLTLAADQLAAVDAICRAVQGLPLALELAAARIRLFTPTELAARLDRPLQILDDGPIDLPRRHRSLRMTIEASLETVEEPARTLFTWLGAVPAGIGLDDLESVAAHLAAPPGWTFAAIGGLVDSSLLRVAGDGHLSRYVLPDAMRELAGEHLVARADHVAVRRAVAVRYLDRLRTAASRSDGTGWAGLDPDADNVRAALTWARQTDPAVVDVATAEAFYRYCEVRGRFVEGRTTLIALADAGAPSAGWALAAAANLSRLLTNMADAAELAARAQRSLTPDDHATRCTVELLLGNLAAERGDFAAGLVHAGAALSIARVMGDDRAAGRALNNLGGMARMSGDLRRAEDYLRESVVVRRRAGATDAELGITLLNIADLTLADRRWPQTAEDARQALARLGHGGHPRFRALAWSILGLAQLAGGSDGDLTGAANSMARAVELAGELGDERAMAGLVQARHSLVQHACGSFDEAIGEFVASVEAMSGALTRYAIAPVIEGHAALLVDRDPVRAARLLGFAAAVRAEQGHAQPAWLQPAAEIAAAGVRLIGPQSYAREYDRGAGRHRDGIVAGLSALTTGEP